MSKTEDFEYFKNVPRYRNFLFDYLRIYSLDLITTFSILQNKSLNFTQRAYYMGYLLNLPIIKDWYRAGIIDDGFSVYPFEEVLSVNESFIYDDCDTSYFKTLIERYYTSINKLAPGKQVPPFTLKDENGRDISLKDFRAKLSLLISGA